MSGLVIALATPGVFALLTGGVVLLAALAPVVVVEGVKAGRRWRG